MAGKPSYNLKSYFIWVLAPELETSDVKLQAYYDFSQSIQEYTRVFESLGVQWKWQPVNLSNYKQVIKEITTTANGLRALVLNLCDGDEINGAPGISVIRELEKNNLIFTGSDAHFFELTTSKIPMKRVFDKYGVSTPRWAVIKNNPVLLRNTCNRLTPPLIIKPAVSGGSMGVSVKNVINTSDQLKERVTDICNGFRGWNLMGDGLFVEQFIQGREFTTFITGSCDDLKNCIVYAPAERVFHDSLPEEEKFLSFDRLWEFYEEESAMPNNAHFYNYHPVEKKLAEELKQLSLDAYDACDGYGYTRIDIRQDAGTGRLYVLEVNAQCGLSEDEDYTSIGAILKFSGVSFASAVKEILHDAIRRDGAKAISRRRKKTVALAG